MFANATLIALSMLACDAPAPAVSPAHAVRVVLASDGEMSSARLARACAAAATANSASTWIWSVPAAPEAPAAPAAPAPPAEPAVPDERPRVYFVDGPEVPFDELEYVESTGRRGEYEARTDTLVDVQPGTSLVLSSFAGDIAVSTWDRSTVRVVAEHGHADHVTARLKDGTLVVGAYNRRGVPTFIDWQLTVPRWMAMQLSGVRGDIGVTGLLAGLKAQTVQGDVRVTSCTGPLEVGSIQGRVRVADARGNVSAHSVNNLIQLERIVGPVQVQSISGDIHLDQVTSTDVEASTVNGRVVFSSPFQPRGRYQLTTHRGPIYVGVPDDLPLDVSVASFNGDFTSAFPAPVPMTPRAPRAPRSAHAPSAPPAPRTYARQFRFAVGAAGDAAPQLQLESFQGRIQLMTLKELRAVADSLRAQLALERARMQAPEAPNPPHDEEDH